MHFYIYTITVIILIINLLYLLLKWKVQHQTTMSMTLASIHTLKLIDSLLCIFNRKEGFLKKILK